MVVRFLGWWALLGLGCAGMAPSAHGQADRLAAVVAEAEAMGVRTGCFVADATTGGVLYAHRSREAFIPASNQKLLTAVAVFEGLGADFSFETRFATRAGVLRVRAAGDPNWQTGGAHDPREILDAVVRRLHAGGVRALRGVELDLGPFVGPRRPLDWPDDQLEEDYCAPTGGLVLDAACFRARISAGTGAEATIDVLAPPAALPIDGAVRLTSNKKRGSLYGLREVGGVLKATGHYWTKADPHEVVKAVRDPELIFRRALEAALERAGIVMRPDAEPLDVGPFAYRSNLAEAVREMLVESSNFHAEQLVRVLAASTNGTGTLAAGVRALREQFGSLLRDLPESWRVGDGSGLSRANRVTPRLVVGVLRLAARQPYAELLQRCLPVPGEGTLEKRFRESPVAASVRAKTGWIRGASALSGYVGDRSFSILMNYDPDRGGLNADLKKLQEQIVEAIANLDQPDARR